jgi:hypothetical protein
MAFSFHTWQDGRANLKAVPELVQRTLLAKPRKKMKA